MKRIAKTKDGDIYEVRLQKMFPNCGKYTKCCIDDKEFWEKYQEKVKLLYKGMLEPDPPEGFEKW